MVTVMRKANLEKNFRMQSHRMEPEMMVVMAEAVMDTPMIISACCTCVLVNQPMLALSHVLLFG